MELKGAQAMIVVSTSLDHVVALENAWYNTKHILTNASKLRRNLKVRGLV